MPQKKTSERAIGRISRAEKEMEVGRDERQSESEARRRAHVLIVPWPAQGHMNPMMDLARKLASMGVAVTFLNTQVNEERLKAANNNNPGRSSMMKNIKTVSLDDGLSIEDYIGNDIPKQSKALKDMEAGMVELGRSLQPPLTCIIGDMYVTSTPGAAQQLGVPHVCFWTQSAASYAAHLLFAKNHATLKDYIAGHRRQLSRSIDCIPGCPPLNINEISSFLRVCDPSDFIFASIMRAFTRDSVHTCTLLNTFHDLEPDSLSFLRKSVPRILTLGPILPSGFLDLAAAAPANSGDLYCSNTTVEKRETSLWVEDGRCISWLDSHSPGSVLYVSFGSLAILSPQQIAEFAAGLEASGYPVLMVVRPALMYGHDAVFPDSFSRRMSGSHLGLSVQWAPQLDVLAHPAVGGFLTHAGWNSTMESISRGVPMLCWPYFSDQMMDSRFIVDAWQIGLDFDVDLSTGVVHRREIEAKVRYLMEPSTSKEIRQNAHQLKLLACKGYNAESKANFESFLHIIQE